MRKLIELVFPLVLGVTLVGRVALAQEDDTDARVSAAVTKYLAEHKGAVEKCLNKLGASRAAATTDVVVAMDLDEDGQARHIDVELPRHVYRASRCLSKAMRGFSIPRPAAPLRLTHTLRVVDSDHDRPQGR
jgi:hypothetical protein